MPPCVGGRYLCPGAEPWTARRSPGQRVVLLLMLSSLTIDQVNIGAGTGEVHVTKHRQSAGVRPGVSHHGVVDEEAAGHEVARHLHSHTTTVQINWFNLVCGLIS